MTASRKARIIPVLMTCFAVFGALKLTGAYIGVAGADAQSLPATQTAPFEPAPTAAATQAPDIADGEVERRILERLAKRRASLEAREEELALRESVLAAAEAKLDRRLEDFDRERAEIAALRLERESEASEEIGALVSAYEKMKSRDAAAIFNELDDDIMLAVAANMRTQSLAGVLADMAPSKARALTELLAERGRLADADTGDADS